MPCPFSKKNTLSIIFFALTALALGIGTSMWATKRRIPLPYSGTRISQELPEFHLIDELGNPFTKQSLKGHYSILFFGYTHCQGICPVTMTLLNQVFEQLKKDKLPLPQIAFITLDPKRDKQQMVASYVKAFNPAFKGITGSEVEIKQFSRQMGVVYMRAQQAYIKDKNYQIDHSGTLYLTNPQGDLTAIFSPPHTTNAIVRDYKESLKMQSKTQN